MKKFFKLFGLAFITFGIAFNVNAGVCDGSDIRDVITVDPYNQAYWDAWAYVCKYTDCVDKYNECGKTYDEAKDWCKTTYQSPGYKNYNHTVNVGRCSDKSVCTCSTCTTTCKLKKVVVTTITDTNCDPALYSDCICVGAVKPVLPTLPEDENLSCSRTYTTTKTTYDTKTITKSYGGENCASESDYENLKKEAEDEAKDECADYASETTDGNKKTTISVVSDTTTCEATHRNTWQSCKCGYKKRLVKGVREAKYVTTGDKGDNIDIYCINPGDEPPGKSQVEAFDATQCESSNSTPECGFSNILIEGYYRRDILNNGNYTYAVIGAAMRLWSAHVGSSGFNDTGIADEDNDTIDLPYSWIHYVPGPGGVYVNVFKATLEYFEKNGGYRNVSTIYEVDTVSGGGTSNLLTVACSDDRMGVFCSGDTGNYLYALSLYANTVQGNKDMQNHLNALNFGGNAEVLEEENNDPESYSTTILSDTKVRITYKLRKNVEIDCSTLPDEIKNSDACKVNQQAIVKDKNGVTIGTANITEYDYCRKNYCYVEVEFSPGVIKCNIIDKFILKAEVTRTCGARSVKKYVGCGNASNYQVMYSFEKDKTCSENPKVIEYMESSFKCNLCDDDVKSTINSCTSETPVTSTISDPSLNCILHKSSGGKDDTNTFSSKTPKHVYDYSDTFKVNTDICRVYCSDKITYKVSGKKTVNNSFQLSYDIQNDLNIPKTGNNKLVSIIEMERNCVSEIFYDEPFDYVKDWSKAYGLGNVKIDNWIDLYNALAEQSKHENDRQELLNKLVYDLYNCNFYEDIVNATGGKVRIPSDSANSYSVAKKLLSNTTEFCNDNKCVTGYIKYEGGAEFIKPSSESELRVGSTANNPYLSSYVDVMTSSINVTYCDKNDCFRQINGKYSQEDFSAAGTSKLSNDNVAVLDVKVPVNDYAIFTVSVVNNIYNPVKYQVQQGTGKVQVEREEDKNIYHTIQKNTFPVSSYAYNLCQKDGNGNTSTCNVYHQYKIPAYTDYKDSFNKKQLLFSRNVTDDNFMAKIEEANAYTCSYKVKGMTDCTEGLDCPREGYIFRNIDLANPVPVNRNNTNWDDNDPYVRGVISEIVNSVNPETPETNVFTSDYYLEYSFVLDATSIEEIRSSNQVSSYYDLPNSCTLITDKNSALYNTYSNCKSSFLNDVRTSNKYSIIVKKGDGISKYTDDKNKLGGGH